MAKLIKSTGEIIPIEPDGKKFSLKRLQELVGGYVEFVPIGRGYYVICDEEGKLKDYPYNHVATVMFSRFYDPFVGDILVCKRNEF